MGNPTTTVLQEILDLSLSIQAVTKNSSTSAHEVPRYSPSPCPFTLPPIPDPTVELRAIGLSDRAVSVLADFFNTKCNLFRSQVERIVQDKMSGYLPQSKSTEIQSALQRTVSNLYTKTIAGLQSDLLCRARHHLAGPQPLINVVKPSKPSFNHDYVPVLEKYFEYNAYPSAADRVLMARKSMMTERQIEVWFQNHRNRARKDGKPLPRLRASEPLPSDVSFDSLDATMADLIRPETERLKMEQQDNEGDDGDGVELLALSPQGASSSRSGSVDSELGPAAPTASPRQQQQVPNPLDPLTPPFAYPAPYVPQLHTFLSPKSRPTAFPFPKPTWVRQPSVTRLSPTIRVSRRDVDIFADLFARLNVREGAQKQGQRRIAPLPQSRSSPVPQQRYASPAATCAITTILCPGRHPAFIPSVTPRATRRARKSPSPPPPPPYQSWMSSPGAGPSKPSTSSTSATAFTFQSPPQYTQSAAPTASASPEPTPTPRRRRKSPQLPRRVPGSPPVAHLYSQSQNQTTSHPTPQRSPRPSHHPYASPSRASASASSHRVSSSSSSSASSSTPTTPNGSTTSLPMPYPVNTPKNTKPTSPIFTAQNIADIFGDAAAFATPSSQGFSGFGTAGFDSPDFGRMQMGNMFDFSFNTSHGPSIVQARS
ncbi:Caudal homeobox family protein [Pleurotus pulmonarius]|nr:hypothetical protein EYR36_007686 [Pleurotus pulmonarius]